MHNTYIHLYISHALYQDCVTIKQVSIRFVFTSITSKKVHIVEQLVKISQAFTKSTKHPPTSLAAEVI